MKLVIVYTNKNDQLKRAEFKGQSTDKYVSGNNCLQWYEIDGKQVSFAEAMNFINAYLEDVA